MTQVITHKAAYSSRTMDLCQEHTDDPPAAMPPLGEVQHGLHDGECEACTLEALTDDRIEALEQEAAVHGDDEMVR